MSRKRQQKQVDEFEGIGEGQILCIVRSPAGANSFECSDGVSSESILAELPARFRKTLWIRRGSFVIVETLESNENSGKPRGEIVVVLQPNQIKELKKGGQWPAQFDTNLAKTVDAEKDSFEEEKHSSEDEEEDEEYLSNPNRR
ncbi:nucleic acid-binding protein [Clavulina sp. PMI_390]|nr:nucleic acid-binding protein [Clavulina sp. PMI_390]